MKSESFFIKNSKQKGFTSSIACLLLLVIYFFAITSCSEKSETIPTPKLEKLTTNTLTPSLTATSFPDCQSESSYRFLELDLSAYIRTIEATQGLINVDTTLSPTADFLYKDVKVTVTLGNSIDVFSFVDLDDLDNKKIECGDILIERTGASYVWYILEPMNNAVYHYSEDPAIDFDHCLNYFPVQEKDPTEYWMQGMEFDTKGGAYCVITNDGRMAIIKYIENSEKYNDDYTVDISFLVSVYKTILK